MLATWHRARGSSSLRALLAYAALGLVANFPVWPGDPARIAACACGGNKDAVQTAWFLAWTPYAILHSHNIFSSNWINYPSGVNLAQNTSMPLLGILTAPLTLAVSPVASENLLRWLAFPASAFAMHAVLCRWVRYVPAAFVGGLLYGFSPYMVGQASVHLDLSFVPLPPLILYALYEIVIRQERSALRWGLLLGVLATAQFYISAEILATTLLTSAIACVLVVLLRPRAVPGHLAHGIAGMAVGAVVLGCSVAYPLYLMTQGPLHYTGPSMGLNEVYNADLLSPILPTSAQLVAPQRLVSIGSTLVGGLANVDENGSYLGIPLLVILAYLAVRYRRQRWLLFALLMAATMFALSLGPRLEIDGRRHRLPIELPIVAISHVPLLDDLLPARLALYVAFFVALAIALGITACRDDRAARERRAADDGGLQPGRAAVVAARAAGAVLVTTAVVALLPRWPYRSIGARPAPAERTAALQSVPAGSVVLTYPYTAPSTDLAMLWQALDAMRFKLLGSYALRRNPTGVATPLPSGLEPYDVEGMLVDPLAQVAVPIPKVPYLAPTSETVDATRIVVGDGTTSSTTGRAPAITGVVQNANPRTRSFFVVDRSSQLVGVQAARSTRYFPATSSPSPFLEVQRGERVTVYGRVAAGTVTARRVADLRTFLRSHHVGAVLVELGRHDSLEVVRWVSRAIGPPTRTGGGGALWLHIQRDLSQR